MKRFTILSGILIALTVSSCTTSKNVSSSEADDRYYSLADAKKERRQAQRLINTPVIPQVTEQTTSAGDNSTYTNPSYQQIQDQSQGSSSSTNSSTQSGSYDMDDSYDFMYSSRIRRFHNPVFSSNYYDPYFTNMYSYNYDPFAYGTSIYNSYSFFNPHVPWGWNSWNSPGMNPGWNSFGGSYFNFGWGNNPYLFNNPYSYSNPWRWNNWGYNPCYSPFAYNPYMFSPYGYGNGFGVKHSQGYMNGMVNGSTGNSSYYNSFDSNSHYYGKDNGGAGSGGSSTLTQNFTQQIGSNYASNTTKYNDGKYASSGGSVETGKPSIGVKSESQGNIAQGVSTTKNTTSKPNQTDKYTSVNTPTQNATNSAVNQKASTQQVNGVEPTTAANGGRVSASNPMQQQPTAAVQKDRAGLIQSGLVQSNSTGAVQTNYTSAPIPVRNSNLENVPSSDFKHQSIITPTQVSQSTQSRSVREVQRLNQTPASVTNQGTSVRSTPYIPNYDYSNGVRTNSNASGNSQNIRYSGNQISQPASSTSTINRNVYQQIQPQQQQNNNQNYTAPQQPRNSYQVISPREYSAPAQNRAGDNRNNAPQQQRDYSVPQQQQKNNYQPNRNNSNQPRNNYNPSNTTPRQEQTRPNNNPSPRIDNSPRMNSGGGTNSGGRMNAPRR